MQLRKQNTKVRFFALGVAIIIALLSPLLALSVNAQSGGGMSFTVHPKLDSKMQDASLGYFNITVVPNTVYDLNFEVVNNSDQEKTYEIGVTNAFTTSNGEINYESVDVIDESLKTPLSTIAQLVDATSDGRITIPASSKKMLTVKVTTPAENYEGIIAGGLRVKDITDRLAREAAGEDTEEASDGAGITIYQEYQMIITIRLLQGESVIAPDFVYLGVEPGIYAYRAAVTASIRNPQSLLVKGAIFNASVAKEGTEDFVFKVTDRSIDFAPNSVMDYIFEDNMGYGLTPGDYDFVGSIEFEGEIWNFEDKFTINPQKAAEINQGALNQQGGGQVSGGVNITMIIIIVIAVLVLLAIILLIVLLIIKSKKN